MTHRTNSHWLFLFSSVQTLSDLDNELKYIADVAVQVRIHYKSELNVWIHFISDP